ncbi:hypothetical protein RN001_004892 [Aquatica leii]|uniref:Glutamate receptor ionotropic, kainate 2 n=1 Tax=Aquatica leii TaxID=1421715 RepID=A0AAN7PC66_9COLE|nr:hypothetical protein RN001_004892 [Aquatica leii]
MYDVKIKFANGSFYFVIFLYFINRNGSVASNVHLGGIFESSNENTELVFEAAVDWFNSYNRLRYSSLKMTSITINQESIYNKRQGFITEFTWNKPITTLQSGCSLLQKGVATIFTHLSEENSDTIQSLCDNKEIPVIQITGRPESESECCAINMFPFIPTLSMAFSELVKSWNWNSFTILYEENEDLKEFADILKLNGKIRKNIILRQIRRNYYGDYLYLLKQVRKSGQRNFVLNFSIENLKDILNQLQKIGLMMKQYNYVILNLDLFRLNLSSYQHSGTNITGFRLIDVSNPVLQEFEKLVQIKLNSILPVHTQFMPYTLNTAMALLVDAVNLTISAIKDYGELTTRSLFCNSSDNWEYGSTMFNYMKMKSFSGITGLVEFNQYGFRTNFNLDVIKLNENGINKIGSWSSVDGLEMITIPNDEKISGSLRNMTFNIMVCWVHPYAMLKSSSNTLIGNDQFEGFSIDLIKALAEIEGFKYNFIRNEDDLNGSWNSETGKWNGMINDILTGTGDLAIGDLTITKDRQNAVDFTEPFMSLGVQILYKKPTTSSPSFFSFAAPFTSDVWLLILLTIFVMCCMLYITARLCPSEWINPYPCVENPRYLKNTYNFSNCVWLIIANLMQEGADFGPRGLSTRVLSSFWSFFILIMISTYTANMAAFLTAEKEEWPFTNIDELVSRSQKLGINYGAVKSGATYKLFKETEDKVLKTAYEYMEDHPEVMVDYFDDGVDRVWNGKENYAFFMESSSIKYVTQRFCNLTAVGKRLDEKYYAIAMKKGSPYRYQLSASIVKLKQSGKIDELERKWWEHEHIKEPCSKKSTVNAAPPLNLKHVSGIFWITLGGILLSALIVVAEMVLKVIKKFTKRERRLAFKEELKFYFSFEKMTKPNS